MLICDALHRVAGEVKAGEVGHNYTLPTYIYLISSYIISA